MFRYILAALAALVLITASLIPDDAFARGGRGGGGMRAGGYHGGGMRAAGVRGGAYRTAGGVAGRGYGYRPIPGRPVARAAVRGGVYRGAAWGAAAGAAALGAYGYYNGTYNNNCGYDSYGNYVCPNQYQY
jgi:hypothetical protein